MFRLDEESVDVIEPAIGCFGYQWARPALKDRTLLYLPSDNSIPHNTNAMGIRNSNRTFEEASFLQPGRACHLAVAVEGQPGREDRVMIPLSTRVDNGDTC